MTDAQVRPSGTGHALFGQFRSFDRPSQILMVNQFAINVGFYMLMPYLAGYLAGPLGLAAWMVGLVLGVRNFSQQGMFLVGGTLADRFGYKPLIVAGCLLRVAGFLMLVFVGSLPAILIASAATGFAGALFNPAVRAYLAADSGERRVQAFAVFNVFYQAGILFGPIIGLALTAWDFRITCAVAAAVFAVLTVIQLMALPPNRAEQDVDRQPVLADWRSVVSNKAFLLFSGAMIGSYVLTFQVYLALPLQAALLTSDKKSETVLVTSIFVVSGLVAIAGQVRLTGWLSARFGPSRSLVLGMLVIAAAFVPLALLPSAAAGSVPAIVALLLAAALLAVGTIATFPFEMDTVVRLARNRLVATHYGLYNTIVGVGILAGNLLTGSIFGYSQQHGKPALLWVSLTGIGLVCGAALFALRRAGLLDRGSQAAPGEQPCPDHQLAARR
ncbi:Multidrug resistance protein MdtH [Mycobacteroides franklinii]|uniref:Multidrug resistance protein MdtH n=3 Tax=Mycobacteriaceae TaxID=1762 RepID=A0A4R8QUE7_9MYCO|nr:Multidrug resistance protein MdtH [Mycobacteroides franklinii]TDZ47586.1 Multidrug resistance protein MdtH [Mycobacteroides franklinii]TDZ58078.1 Multidrug resistance protein MdtH [Mycobacteroides franklinii]TDZ61344.1 Multidrug resistance protein MdtH [Mycobacteroides franklinii]TDZ71417.1 Multidrug resistance protein MdtH [Mycobacteroides franklinii]